MYSKYTGVILKKYPFGEADEILTIYTRQVGKLCVKAVSSRKIKSKLGGALQSLNEIDFEIAGAGQIPVLISVRTRTVNNYLRQNLKKFAHALVGVETLYRLTADRQENRDVYEALLSFLRNLEKAVSENLEVRMFQLKLLKLTGFGFNLEDLALGDQDQKALHALLKGEPAKLSLAVEGAIDGFLQNVLEREIRSKGFLQTINQEN